MKKQETGRDDGSDLQQHTEKNQKNIFLEKKSENPEKIRNIYKEKKYTH